jgi:Zn-dependent M28 family amino/carboxypeptidase
LDAHDRLRAHLSALIGERHPITAPAALLKAEAYLTAQFRDRGLEVAVHPFEALGGSYRNVIGTRSPRDRQAKEAPLIVGAHYDTVVGSPGADDNASGLAVMLEVADRVRSIPLARPVRFIAFCLEEYDLLGSVAYAAALRAGNQSISGAIILECVGYTAESQLAPPNVPVAVPPTGDFLAVVGNSASASLVAAIESSGREAGADLKLIPLVVPGQGELLPDTRRSDHAAFWQYGYPAVMLTDTANFRNPHYHRPTDLIDTLNFSFMDQVTTIVTAVVIRLAGVNQVA